LAQRHPASALKSRNSVSRHEKPAGENLILTTSAWTDGELKMGKPNGINDVPTQIKNRDLVARRRNQIVEAAAKLFIEKGFHKTTTRQIAQATGFSIGSLYEYVTSKEDVLYLVCESIHAEVERGVAEAMARAEGGRKMLAEVIREYFLVCHRMSDFILLIYQETQSLPSQWRKRVLENELRITGILVEVLGKLMASGDLPNLQERSIEIIAHNICVLGHMWTFRRWFLSRHYSIDDYIEIQTDFIVGLIT
jgi:AcrR family transcriptional regulator